jgi:hypothetical protein
MLLGSPVSCCVGFFLLNFMSVLSVYSSGCCSSAANSVKYTFIQNGSLVLNMSHMYMILLLYAKKCKQ